MTGRVSRDGPGTSTFHHLALVDAGGGVSTVTGGPGQAFGQPATASSRPVHDGCVAWFQPHITAGCAEARDRAGDATLHEHEDGPAGNRMPDDGSSLVKHTPVYADRAWKRATYRDMPVNSGGTGGDAGGDHRHGDDDQKGGGRDRGAYPASRIRPAMARRRAPARPMGLTLVMAVSDVRNARGPYRRAGTDAGT